MAMTRLYLVVAVDPDGHKQVRVFDADKPSTAAKVAAGSHHAIMVYRAPAKFDGPSLKWVAAQWWHLAYTLERTPEAVA